MAKHLLRSDSHIVVDTDKNLGGCIMERETYIVKGILKHLGNNEVHQKLATSNWLS